MRLICGSLALVILFFGHAFAEIEVGSKVVLIRPVELNTDGGSRLRLSPGTVLDVRRIAEQTFTVGSPRVGSVPAADVIPLDDAERFFSDRLGKNAQDAEAWTGRGKIWFHRLEQDKAISDFDESLRLRLDPETMTLRAFAWKSKGNKEQAMALLDEAIKLEPNNALAWRVRGATFASLGDYPKTLAHYTESIRIDPDNPESILHRAILQSGCQDASIRDGKQAVVDATKACELTGWDQPLFLNCLSFAYSESGDFDQAIYWQKKVIEMSPNRQNQLAQDRIEQFRQKKPFRTTWR
jgi:tetratricopeptide (TPR) repeat protein